MTYDCGVYDWNLDRKRARTSARASSSKSPRQGSKHCAEADQNHFICVGTDDEIMIGSFAPEASPLLALLSSR